MTSDTPPEGSKLRRITIQHDEIHLDEFDVPYTKRVAVPLTSEAVESIKSLLLELVDGHTTECFGTGDVVFDHVDANELRKEIERL